VQHIVTELIVKHDWLIVLVFIAGLVALQPVFEAKSLRGRLFSIVVFCSLGFAFWGMLALRDSEYGRWIDLQPDSPTPQYVAFLQAFPGSHHADQARTVVRSRQRSHLQSWATPVARAILEACA
jgi:hypothetical protein